MSLMAAPKLARSHSLSAGSALHQREPAELRRRELGHRRQRRECLALARSMQAFPRGIEHDQHAPRIGKRNAADDGRGPRHGTMPTIDDEPAVLEQADAHARAGATVEAHRIARRVERQAMQTAQRSRHAQRELRAGAQSRVGRNDLIDRDAVGGIESEHAPHGLEMTLHALALRSDDPGALPALAAPGDADRQPGLQSADRQPDAAEPPAEPAVEIEEAEMQPRRRRDGHARRPRGRCISILSSRHSGLLVHWGSRRGLAIGCKAPGRDARHR